MVHPSFESEMRTFLSAMGFNELPEEKQNEVLAQLRSLVEEEVEFELDKIIPESEKEHFSSLSLGEQDIYLAELGIEREEISLQKTEALMSELKQA